VTASRPLWEARRALAEGSLAASELLERHLAQLDRREPQVRAMVTLTIESARKQAADADDRLARGDSSPLLGIPVVVKDLIDVAGVPTTAGSKVLQGNIPASSSPAWLSLEAAGAVLIGKANTHEFAYGGTTEPTRNPADVSRMVGGSSGGPAAALAADFCLGALGSDTAGSIRIPANLCGVAGLKPTRGTVSSAGVVPLSPTLDIVGPMARHVGDLDPLFRVLAPSADGWATGDELATGLRVGVLAIDGPSDPAARAAVEQAAEALGRHGAHVSRALLEGLEKSLAANFTIMGFEAASYHRQWEHLRDLYTPYVRDRLAEASDVTQTQYDDAREYAETLAGRLDCVLDDFDVLVLRGVAFPAPPAYDATVLIDGEWRDRDTELCRNTAFANLTGHPVVAVPVLREGHLPLGIQLLGPRGSDLRLIAIGARLQDEVA
jgi:aspartyl-tRNA(Asn)/glutamyl-tRNA(Gln) amidotransferase subunit A